VQEEGDAFDESREHTRRLEKWAKGRYSIVSFYRLSEESGRKGGSIEPMKIISAAPKLKKGEDGVGSNNK